MSKFWRIFLCLLLVFIISGTFAMAKYENTEDEGEGENTVPGMGAATETVNIAQHELNVNGILFQDNDYDNYPVLVRDGVTYVPLTFYMSNLLNIHLWENEEGVYLETRIWDNPKPFLFDGYGEYNDKGPKVTVLNKKLWINESLMEETGPLLEFREIIYLPLTEAVAEALQWTLAFDEGGSVNVECDNFIYISDLYTLYKQAGLTVEAELKMVRTGPAWGNLNITKDGQAVPIQSSFEFLYFGYDMESNNLFSVKDGFVYTSCLRELDNYDTVPCRIEIATGQVIFDQE